MTARERIVSALAELDERLSALEGDRIELEYAIEDLEHPAENAAPPPVHLASERPPRMTWMRWTASQGVDLGATSRRAWYWRLPSGVWSGPYYDVLDAKRDAMDANH